MIAGAFAQWTGQVGTCLTGAGMRAAGQPRAELIDRLIALAALQQQVYAAELDVVRELGEHQVAPRRGFTSFTAWLSETLRVSPTAAGAMTRMAKFTAEFAPVDAGLRSGTVNVEQAQVIEAAIADMPAPAAAPTLLEEGIAEHHRQLAASLLAGSYGAGSLPPRELRLFGAGILHYVAPETADELERRSLERSEREAHVRRGFTMSAQTIGGYRLSGHLTAEAAAIVREAIESLTAPRVGQAGNQFTPTAGAGTQVGQGIEGRSVQDGSPDDVADPSLDGDVGVGERRSPAQQRADALVEVCKLALRTGKLPAHGGDRPQLQVTIPFDVLTGQLAAGMLDTGDQVTPTTARRLACDANIVPVVLGSAGQVLDVGRSQRLVGGALRRALIIRDGGCTFPGCDRRPRWTEGHHIVHWSSGGETCLDNTVLLCGFHHRLIHQGDWTVRLAADGLPEFLPPSCIDPDRAPRRNQLIALRCRKAWLRNRRQPPPSGHQRT